jgi:predicted nucleic acid-binding protein
VIAAQLPSCPWLKPSDYKSKFDTRGLVVLIAKSVQALQYLRYGPLLGCRRHGERERQSDADYPNPNLLRQLARLPIVVDGTPEETAVLTLARRHGLTVYDGSYLELAERSAAPLATLDVTLAQAAERENISLIGQET